MIQNKEKEAVVRIRLRQFIKFLGISDRQFEKNNNFYNGYVGKMSKLDDGKVAILEKAYPELNVNWLLTGEGSMLNEAELSEKTSPKNKTPFQENDSTFHSNKVRKEFTETPFYFEGLQPTENKTLPLIPIDAVAGVPSGDFQGVRFSDCEQYDIPEFAKQGAEFLIRVSGSSMYPKYSNGDILACKKITEILFIQWGKVYVIDSSQGSLVKRLFEDKDNQDNLLCVSDNKENYPPFSIPKKDIRSLSLVVGVIRLE